MTAKGDIQSAVRDFILEEFLSGEEPAKLTNDYHLVDNGGLDSMNVLRLVDFLEEEYDIELEPTDIRQMTSVSNIVRVVESHAAG